MGDLTITRIPDTDIEAEELGLDANYPNFVEKPVIVNDVAGMMDSLNIVQGEAPEYEITARGMKETWDPSKPGEAPVADPLSLAKIKLNQLQAINRLLKRDKRSVLLEERHKAKVKKSRRRAKLAKAARKKQRK